jgi:hypothetical protein
LLCFSILSTASFRQDLVGAFAEASNEPEIMRHPASFATRKDID